MKVLLCAHCWESWMLDRCISDCSPKCARMRLSARPSLSLFAAWDDPLAVARHPAETSNSPPI